jgi:hypothetical protein
VPRKTTMQSLAGRAALAFAAALVCAVATPAAAQVPPGGPPGRPGERPPGPPRPPAEASRGWRVRASAQTDLWFHTLAVIAADQPGPLGLYSADYARHIRDVKQQKGVYPTALDSVAPDLRAEIGQDRKLEVLHFVPLYFPNAGPLEMLEAIRSATRGSRSMGSGGGSVGYGMFVVMQASQDGKTRRLLEKLADVAEKEWNAFYRDYWDTIKAQQDSLASAMELMWDTQLEPGLQSFLEQRRLTGGLIMPSQALGPEGRIVELQQEMNAGDQVVAVQEPIVARGPEATVFAFLKELCFLLIDDQKLSDSTLAAGPLEDLRRTAAVRCGATILDFYAPQQAARYRRTFLDAVGAEDAATVEAFQRVYYLDPAIVERIHRQIRTR